MIPRARWPSASPPLHVKAIAPALWAPVKTAADIPAATATGRQVLARDDADLVIWGALNDISGHLEIRFVARAPNGQQDGGEHPGAFLVTDRLVLPAAFAAPFAKLLVAVAVAATSARSELHRRWLEGQLSKALEDVQEGLRAVLEKRKPVWKNK